MKVIEGISQGSEDWNKLRLGLVTASRFKDAKGKSRRTYLYQLAAETITGQKGESFSSKYIEWGNETEPQARAMYEFHTGVDVKQVTFIKMDNKKIGCSPDGLVGNDGLVEFKCPKTTTQIETFLSGKMPDGHTAQVQGQLWVAHRQWCDFVSFDPRINGGASFFKIRIERDNDYIKELSEKILTFEEELLSTIKRLGEGQ